MKDIIVLKSRSIGRTFDNKKVIEELKAQGKEIVTITPESLKQSQSTARGRTFSSRELIDRLNLINGGSTPFEP